MPYISTDELKERALQQDVLAYTTAPQQLQAVLTASAIADSYLRRRFTLPLSAYGDDLRQAVADIATYKLAVLAKLVPEGVEGSLRQGYTDAVGWLKDVSRGLAELSSVADAGGQAGGGGLAAPVVSSRTPRGW